MTAQPTTTQLARRVAKALDLRVSRTRVPMAARNMTQTALLKAQRGQAVNLERELEAAARLIQPDHERTYYVALFLLEYAWMLRPGAPAAEKLLELFRWYYDACRTDNHDLWEGLRAELVDRQWSSFPLVRLMASAAQGDGPATPDEVAMLADDLVPHESRFRVAVRVLRNVQSFRLTVGDAEDDKRIEEQKVQTVRLTAFFEYLRRLHADGTRTPPDANAELWTEDLLSRLKTALAHKDVFDAMFMAYLKVADDSEFNGRLQHLLASASNHSIETLKGYAKGNASRLRPIARIFEHMTVHFKNEQAGAALVDLIVTAPAQEKYKLVDLFVNAGRELARHWDVPQLLKDLFDETADRFRDTHGGLSQMAADLEKLPWGQQLSAQDVVDYLDRKPNHQPLAAIRECGPQGYDVIQQYARDPKRDEATRLRAIYTAIDLKARNLQDRVRQLFWDLYHEDTSPDQKVKAAAARGIRKKERHLTREVRRALHPDYLTAKPVLRRVFEEDLSWWFGEMF